MGRSTAKLVNNQDVRLAIMPNQARVEAGLNRQLATEILSIHLIKRVRLIEFEVINTQ